ncbi:MAG: YdbH domain-containing protein [Magnetospirillum sp. WYHS-4]
MTTGTRRRLLGTAAGLIALAAFGAATLSPRLPGIAESAALAALARAGFPEAALSLDGIGWSRLTAADLRLAPGAPSIRRLEIDFSLWDILVGRRVLDRVVVVGLDLPLVTDGSGIRVAGLPNPAADGGDSLWTLNSLVLDDAILRLEGASPAVTPLRLDGKIDRGDDGWNFFGRLNAAEARLTLEFSGRHSGTEGAAQLELKPVHFVPGRLQPRDISPAYAAAIQDLTATVSGKGPLRWNAKGLQGDLRIDLADGSVDLGGLRLEKIAGGLRLLALNDVRLDGLTVQTAQGTFTVAPMTLLAPKPGRHEGRIVLNGVSAQALLDAFQVSHTAVDGRLQGTIPFALDHGRLVVADGNLETASPGTLHYAPPAPPAALQAGGGGASLMLSALKNFHYEELRLTADRGSDGEWQARIRLAGRNPELLEGRPFEFNINIGGALDAILRHGLEGWRLPQALADALVRQGTN